MLGNDECSRLSVALQETKETKKNNLSGLSCTQRCRPQTYSPQYLHPSFNYIALSLSHIHTHIKIQTADQSGTASNTGDVWSHDHAVGPIQCEGEGHALQIQCTYSTSMSTYKRAS